MGMGTNAWILERGIHALFFPLNAAHRTFRVRLSKSILAPNDFWNRSLRAGFFLGRLHRAVRVLPLLQPVSPAEIGDVLDMPCFPGSHGLFLEK